MENGFPNRAWSPTLDIPNLRFLADFQSNFYTDAGTTPVSAVDDRVSQWNDRIGTKHLRAINDASRPYYSTTVKNGIRMDGTNARTMYYANGSEILGEEQSLILIIGFTKTVTTANSFLIGRGGVTSTTAGMWVYTNSVQTIGGLNFRCTTGGSTTTLSSSTGFSTNALCVTIKV